VTTQLPINRPAGAGGGARVPVATTAILQEGQVSSPTRRGRCGAGRLRADRALFEHYLERRDPVDRDMLVERFLPLARGLARRYQAAGEPFDDLFQVACLGLLKAIDRFDLSRDVAFSSYAVPTMLGEIRRYFRDRTWSVRVPRDLQELALRVDRKVFELSSDLHRQPTVAEIAHAAAATEEQVLEALQASWAHRATSLEAPCLTEDAADATLGDTVASTEQGFSRAEDRATLAPLLRAVTPRERKVLRLYFEDDLTQRQIGERIGVSQMQTSRIIRKSITRLRTAAHT
jgi:RNA polymerase sigma-B factor